MTVGIVTVVTVTVVIVTEVIETVVIVTEVIVTVVTAGLTKFSQHWSQVRKGIIEVLETSDWL